MQNSNLMSMLRTHHNLSQQQLADMLHVSLKTYKDYKQEKIQERHRHRYEFNNQYREILEKHGMVFSGYNEKSNLMEIIEIPGLKYFIAGQFHPEFKSRPTRPHPLFDGLIRASIGKK